MNFFTRNQVLAQTKVKCLSAFDGLSALELLKYNSEIELVLADIRLPDINGFELIEEIKESYPKITIIAQTAYANIEDKQKCILSGCNDYISKPIDKDILIKTIAKYIK